MDRPLKEHIARIEREIDSLNQNLMRTKDRPSANAIEAQIRALKLAISHYEMARKIEQDVLSGKG